MNNTGRTGKKVKFEDTETAVEENEIVEDLQERIDDNLEGLRAKNARLIIQVQQKNMKLREIKIGLLGIKSIVNKAIDISDTSDVSAWILLNELFSKGANNVMGLFGQGTGNGRRRRLINN